MRKFLMFVLVAAGLGAALYNEFPAIQRELKIIRM